MTRGEQTSYKWDFSKNMGGKGEPELQGAPNVRPEWRRNKKPEKKKSLKRGRRCGKGELKGMGGETAE